MTGLLRWERCWGARRGLWAQRGAAGLARHGAGFVPGPRAGRGARRLPPGTGVRGRHWEHGRPGPVAAAGAPSSCFVVVFYSSRSDPSGAERGRCGDTAPRAEGVLQGVTLASGGTELSQDCFRGSQVGFAFLSCGGGR